MFQSFTSKQKFGQFSIIFATWPFGKSPLPLVAFRDLLADPLPPPNYLGGFWMASKGIVNGFSFKKINEYNFVFSFLKCLNKHISQKTSSFAKKNFRTFLSRKGPINVEKRCCDVIRK